MRFLRVALLATLLLCIAAGVEAAEITLMSANGMRDSVKEVHAQIEKQTGHRVTTIFDEAGNLRRRLEAGEAADIVVLPRPVMNQVQTSGKIVAATILDL